MGVSGQRHAPAAFILAERTTGTHWIGGCLGLRAGLDAEVRRRMRFAIKFNNQNLYNMQFPLWSFVHTRLLTVYLFLMLPVLGKHFSFVQPKPIVII
jgi:hypothetical protein